MLSDKRMSVKLKGNVYKTMVRPALLCGAGTWATTRGQETRLYINEVRMLRWMCGVTRRDKIRNEHNRGTTRVMQASKNITEQRLKWYGHVRRMKEEHIVRRMLDVDTWINSQSSVHRSCSVSTTNIVISIQIAISIIAWIVRIDKACRC